MRSVVEGREKEEIQRTKMQLQQMKTMLLDGELPEQAYRKIVEPMEARLRDLNAVNNES